MTVTKRCKRNLERGDPTVSEYTAGGRHPFAMPCYCSFFKPVRVRRMKKSVTVLRVLILISKYDKRIPERIEEDLNGFFLPQCVARIRLSGPRNKILTDKQAMELLIVPAKPNFRTPSRWPAGRVLQQRKSRAIGPDRIQSIQGG